MPVKQHRVRLAAQERMALRQEIARGVAPARRLARARILLKADEAVGGPRLSDVAIGAAVEVSPRTVARVRSDFATGGMARALARQPPRRVYLRAIDPAAEVGLIAIACSPPPAGHARWTVRLLADRLVVLQLVDHVCPETVRTTLKKTNSNPGR
jgi:Homeodomain-like domain